MDARINPTPRTGHRIHRVNTLGAGIVLIAVLVKAVFLIQTVTEAMKGRPNSERPRIVAESLDRLPVQKLAIV